MKPSYGATGSPFDFVAEPFEKVLAILVLNLFEHLVDEPAVGVDSVVYRLVYHVPELTLLAGRH